MPVAGALVTVEHGTAPTPEIALKTNADGMCRLALPPGRFTVAAFFDGRAGRIDVADEAGATIRLAP